MNVLARKGSSTDPETLPYEFYELFSRLFGLLSDLSSFIKSGKAPREAGATLRNDHFYSVFRRVAR